MPAIAFFPWLKLEAQLAIGAVRLLPWERGAQPGDTSFATQSDLDAVLAAYADRPNVPRTSAVLLEINDWRTGMDADDALVSELFRVRDLVAFAALSKRTLFRGHFDYTNSDSYQLVVQRYERDRASRFSFRTRRRDGEASYTWGSDSYAFFIPHHVSSRQSVDLDAPLLSVLTGAEIPQRMRDAIVDFNHANTDSPDVQTHVELIRAKTSMEWLFNIGEKYQDLQRKLRELLPPQLEIAGPLRERWQSQYPNATTLVEKWAQEFCIRRGMSAHASNRKSSQRVWSENAHLAFYSVLFPLLVKKVLAEEGKLKLDAYDGLRLQRLEAYLVRDPFEIDNAAAAEERWPWSEVDADMRMRCVGLILTEKFRRGQPDDLASEDD